MSNNTTLDAAIVAAQEQVYNNHERVVDPLDRTYARALIAKLTDKMKFVEPCDTWADGFNAGISEIRRRAGIEGGES